MILIFILNGIEATEKPKSDNYSDKLKELVSQLPQSTLSENKDYVRLTNKLRMIETKIQQSTQDIDRTSKEILRDKTMVTYEK